LFYRLFKGRLIIVILIFGFGCGKDTCQDVTTVAPATEVSAVETYLASKSISATKDTRGFYFVKTLAGGNAFPTICNSVTVKYSGFLTNGTKFDESTAPTTFNLSDLITGWKEGIPLIGKGGKITLYLPPSLAYGVNGSGTIPPNAVLIFDIELVDFQ
jgi:FKBP-type peptidyl-prolyl cis-trans isomerase FkpA